MSNFLPFLIEACFKFTSLDQIANQSITCRNVWITTFPQDMYSSAPKSTMPSPTVCICPWYRNLTQPERTKLVTQLIYNWRHVSLNKQVFLVKIDIIDFSNNLKLIKESFSPCSVLSVIDSWPSSLTILKPKQVEILGILDKNVPKNVLRSGRITLWARILALLTS